MMENRTLFYEPVQILNNFSEEKHGAEMSECQLAFLCGLLKKHRPHKIVEVGVAAGGTTCVILNCITMLQMDSKLISIDSSEYYYRDKSKYTGYLIDTCTEMIDGKSHHVLYTGKMAVECLEMIGKDVDFLILDTVHSMPGEFLDFLAFFPYLKYGAVVVLHDTLLNHINKNPKQIATRLLLDTVVAEKLYAWDEDDNLLNMGGFIINEDTSKYIGNLFSVLMVTWGYYPSKEVLSQYRDWYRRHYEKEQLLLFDIANCMNQRTLEEQRLEERCRKQDEFMHVYHWIENIKSMERKIYIYGSGYFGKKLYYMLEQCGIQLSGYLISDGQDRENTENIYYLSEINLEEENIAVLVGVGSELLSEICDILLSKGIDDYIIPNKYIYNLL